MKSLGMMGKSFLSSTAPSNSINKRLVRDLRKHSSLIYCYGSCRWWKTNSSQRWELSKKLLSQRKSIINFVSFKLFTSSISSGNISFSLETMRTQSSLGKKKVIETIENEAVELGEQKLPRKSIRTSCGRWQMVKQCLQGLLPTFSTHSKNTKCSLKNFLNLCWWKIKVSYRTSLNEMRTLTNSLRLQKSAALWMLRASVTRLNIHNTFSIISDWEETLSEKRYEKVPFQQLITWSRFADVRSR